MMKAAKTWVLIVLLIVPAINLHAWPIPDTGQTKGFNNTAEIRYPTPGEVSYAQEWNYIINPLSYPKSGTGGLVFPDSATTWAMMRDGSRLKDNEVRH